MAGGTPVMSPRDLRVLPVFRPPRPQKVISVLSGRSVTSWREAMARSYWDAEGLSKGYSGRRRR